MNINYIFQNPDTTRFWSEGLLVLLGGLISGLIAFFSQKYLEYKKEEKEKLKVIDTKKVIHTELKELEFLMMLLVYKIESKYGDLDRKLLEWAEEIISRYNGVNFDKNISESIAMLLTFSDSELSSFHSISKSKETKKGLELKKISLFLFNLDFSVLASFDPELRSEVLDLKSRVSYLNQIVDDARYYFQLSFQKGISETNYQNADINMVSSYKNYSIQAKIIIKLIQKIIPKML